MKRAYFIKYRKKIAFAVVVTAGLVGAYFFVSYMNNKKMAEQLSRQSIAESLLPVKPGFKGLSPFWNTYSKRFIYAPSFDFKEWGKVKYYRYTALSFVDKREYIFEAKTPWEPLSPIWKDLPVGDVYLKVEACDNTSGPVGLSGECKFYKAAPFSISKYKPLQVNATVNKKLLKYIYTLAHVQHWAKGKGPDPEYSLYCYPSKTIAAVIKTMLLYSGYFPEDLGKALSIARNAADYLISISEPGNTPLAYWPPTYSGTQYTAKANQGNIMVGINAGAGNCYLDLYDATKDRKYLDAAVGIADTYLKTQLPSGTWYVKLKIANAQPFASNLATPISIVNFLERLSSDYKLEKYRYSAEKAFAWIIENPVRTFNWEPQYEDAPIAGKYENLTMHDPCSVAIYLLNHAVEKPEYIPVAMEIIRFVEDQFVVWKDPMPYAANKSTDSWHTPSVLEQYFCYIPIDASVSKMLATFYIAYEILNEPIYLAKATALYNALIKKQQEDGMIPTAWYRYASVWWINCAMDDAIVLSFLENRGRFADMLF